MLGFSGRQLEMCRSKLGGKGWEESGVYLLIWNFIWLESGVRGKGRYLATGIGQRITNKIFDKVLRT